MARRRGILAEIQHQAKMAERERARAEREQERAYLRAVREAEQARKAEERALAQAARAEAAERKRLEKMAKDAHVASMEAEADRLNAQLETQYNELDGLLAATLDVDDFVDLDTLRREVCHPPFDRPDLEEALPPPEVVHEPIRPQYVAPPEPKGLAAIVGKKRHAMRVSHAEQLHAHAVKEWESRLAAIRDSVKRAHTEHMANEERRKQELALERRRYDEECLRRETEVSDHNRSIDELIANLGYGVVDAVHDYISIVLSNSVYPDFFDVQYDFEFEPGTAELDLKAIIPSPDRVPTAKSFRYVKSKDEIVESALSQKACRDRYSEIIAQIALRTLHEVFEADRRGIITSISLQVGTETIDPATGREVCIPFIAVAAERDSFLQIKLENVQPSATLEFLGASVSKNPHGLVAADASGVRRQ